MRVNQGLEKAIADLQAQVARQEKLLQLCRQVINEFSHFVPSIFKEFEIEMEKLGADAKG